MKNELSGKLITCILPKGGSPAVMEKLHEMGVTRISFAHARGFDIHDEPEKGKSIPKEEEKEIMTVVAKDEAEGEKLFDLIYREAGLDALGGGIMYMTSLSAAMAYSLT